ncbi:MAG: Fic family protein [Holosporaceae bacterium]|jgi:Fic family protein|nr:Fic family protein [Holosporaceae bacterium]
MHRIFKQIQELLLKIPPDSFAVITKWLRVELTYTSNHIEGNTLTRAETALTVEKGLTSGSKPVKDYLEAKNHAEAFDYIVSLINQEKVDYEDVILKIHSMILNGIDDNTGGRYRNVRVRIAGADVVLPNPLKVPDLMRNFAEKLCKKPDSLLKAFEAHYKLVEIHPFTDGNGRTARLLMNLILMRAGYLPVVISPIERKRYISGINSRNTKNNLLGYHRYMLRMLKKSLDMYVKLFGERNAEPDSSLMKIGEFAKYCNVPQSTLRYYLRIKKIEPISYTNSGYMLFSKEQAGLLKKSDESLS